MIRNYFKIAFRNLARNLGYSAINIGGLALGMSVAMLIGLWIYDELSYDRYNERYSRIGKIWQFVTFEVEKQSFDVTPIPMAEELRSKYPDFEAVSLSRRTTAILTAGDKKFETSGDYVEPGYLDIMTVDLVAGSKKPLDDTHSIMLSETLAKSIFGDRDPIDRIVRIDNKEDLKVTSVYRDFPDNTNFNETAFILPWKLLLATDPYARGAQQQWDENSWQLFVLLKEGADFGKVSAKIKDIRVKKENPPAYKPEFFVQPMSDWHLRSDFENGVNVGGRITFVWLFGAIGAFVLLLACINFMNLSTARSEKRAKEVGVRKAVGSLRSQLIKQFFSESYLVVLIAYCIALAIGRLALPFFNGIAGKSMKMPWELPQFWLFGLGFCLLTGLVAGSYPAFYLSSFQPIKVLKAGSSSFRAGFGRLASIPRKMLVVVQFTVSVTLVIGTIVVFKQIQFAKNRPVGYNRSGLIEVYMNTPDLSGHFDALRQELLASGAASEISQSSGSVTEQFGGTTDMVWPGKKPEEHPLIMSNFVSHEYGKTIGWTMAQGRDFSRDFGADSAAMILNETAVKIMRLEKPLETIVKRGGRTFRIIGVVKDMIKENPFSKVNPSFFAVSKNGITTINVRLTPEKSPAAVLPTVESIFNKYNPASPFVYKFVDEQYAKKFGDETRIGTLATFFAVLAIFISCLGLFGLASFVAEQRTKEIGIRKVLGASLGNLWQLLSSEFLALVVVSFLVSCPIAWYMMSKWLEYYTYKVSLSWWIFAFTGIGALLITVFTVSFQAIRAALVNPVKALRAE